MIIYEVNIIFPKSIYNTYIIWLKKHITEMLTFNGFMKNKIYLINSKDTTDVNLCVHYYIASIKYYDLYIKNNSKKMQSNKFTNTITIKRRLLIEGDL